MANHSFDNLKSTTFVLPASFSLESSQWSPFCLYLLNFRVVLPGTPSSTSPVPKVIIYFPKSAPYSSSFTSVNSITIHPGAQAKKLGVTLTPASSLPPIKHRLCQLQPCLYISIQTTYIFWVSTANASQLIHCFYPESILQLK